MKSPNDVDVKKVRQKNGLPAVPPHISAVAPVLGDHVFSQRRVQKGGAVIVKQFREGASVRIVSIDNETCVISTRSVDEVARIAAAVPRDPISPYAGLMEQLRSTPQNVEAQRLRGAYVGPIVVPQLTDEEALRSSSTARTRRVR